MRELNYVATVNEISVKSVLKNEFCLSSSVITSLKNSGGIMVNGSTVTVRKIMKKGDNLKLVFPETDSGHIVPKKAVLDVLYEDEDILCVNKPSGIPTHPSQNHHSDTLANIVCYYYRDIPFTFRVSNRLDSYTSGVVVIAKNIYSASFLCTESFRKSIHKTYYAICRGIFEKKEGSIIAPIKRLEGSTIKRVVSPDGQYAETYYRVVAEKDDLSLVMLMPKTGRTHQIRVQMAHIGHPLKDDFLYDEKSDDGKRFFLHCETVSFVHPCTKQKITVNAPLPEKGIFIDFKYNIKKGD